MKKMEFHRTMVFLLVTLFIISCNNKDDNTKGLEGMNFGESVYFEPFLWVKSDTLILSKSMKFEFSDYAVEEKSKLKFQFINDNKNQLDNSKTHIYLDDKLIKDGIITIEATDNILTKKIGLKFLPSMDDGEHSGYLTVVNHDFDRIENFDKNSINQDARILRWTGHYEKDYNPLLLGVFWFFVLILGLLLIWFLILRNTMFPKFKRGKIQILSPYFGAVRIDKNTKLIIFTNRIQKQKTINKIFTGKITYEVNSIYENDILFRPGRGNTIKIRLPIEARIVPPVVNIDRYSRYKIELNDSQVEFEYS